MKAIRLFVYGIPVLLIVLFVAAFVNATLLTTRKKNEFTFGTIAEPTKLNPVQSTDLAASEVEGLIFESLLSYNQNLELEPLLAESYTESQETFLRFRSPEDAAAALATLESVRDSWANWTLKDVRQEGDQLILTQDLPGYRYVDQIIETFDTSKLIPLASFRANLGSGARDALAAFRKQHPEITIEREWFDYDVAFEITVQDEGDAERKLEAFLKTLNQKDATLSKLDQRHYIAEPILRFQLRKGVKWQDGTPFTAEDCVFTYDMIMDEAVISPRKADYDPIKSVSAPTPHEFVVRYRAPYSPAILSWEQMRILPKHILEGKSQDWWSRNFNRRPVGTGPFKFHSWKTNEVLRIVRNPDYWGQPPWLDAVEFRPMPDPTVLRLAFETHQLDIYEAILSPWAVRSYKKNPKFTTLTVSALSYGYIGWNMRLPMFEDIRVRKALAMALNVDDIIEFVYYGVGAPSNGPILPEFWYGNPHVKRLPYDPEKAKQLLDEAGWKPGPDGIRQKDGKRLSFTIITNQGNDVRKDIATLAQDAWRKIGVEAKVEIYEWAVFIERFVKKHEFEALVLGWVMTPNWDQYQLWHSSQTGPDLLNYAGFKNAEVDQLIEDIRVEYDRERIRALGARFHQLIYDEQPTLFLNFAIDPIIVWKDTFRIRRKTAHGWIDEPFQVAPSMWYYFIPETYRTEYADLLPKETEVTQ